MKNLSEDQNDYFKIQDVSEQKTEKLGDDLIFCTYCNEPFKECDMVVLGIGVFLGETDVKQYRNKFWHRGCIDDFLREAPNGLLLKLVVERLNKGNSF